MGVVGQVYWEEINDRCVFQLTGEEFNGEIASFETYIVRPNPGAGPSLPHLPSNTIRYQHNGVNRHPR